MYEHEIRWFVLVPVAVLTGIFALFAEVSGIWFAFPARPDWLWCVAVFACLKAPPVQTIFAFACCGLVRDVFLGPRPGAALLAYIITGWLLLHWKTLASARGWTGQLALAFLGGLIAAVLKHTLDYGYLASKLWYWILAVSAADALVTMAAYPLVAILLTAPSFRPWREKSVFVY